MINLVKVLLIKERCYMKRLISTVTAFMMIFTLAVFLPEGAIRAGAISGTGAKANPYIVTTFDELKNILSPSDTSEHSFTKDTDIYVRLGKDISQKDLSMDNYIETYSNSAKTVNYHLDLAGHTLYRESEYCRYLFMISSNSCLTINDSVGSGKIETKLVTDFIHPHTFFVMGGGNLVIENGTFTSLNTKTQGYIEEYILNMGGDVTINGGTFSSYDRVIEHDSGTVTINDGTFIIHGTHPENAPKWGLSLCKDAKIYNCTLIGTDEVAYIETTGCLIPDILPDNYTITADGENKKVTDFEQFSGDNSKPYWIYGRELIIKSPEKIDRVDLTLTEPKAGEKPDNTAAVTKGEAKVTLVQWTENNVLADTFEEGKTYNARLLLSPLEGYTFTENTKVYFNGKQAEIWPLSQIIGFKGNVAYDLDFDCKGARIPGDATDDGAVDIKDVTVLKQYLAKWNVMINTENADVDGDREVTIKDLTILKQYLAKWKVELK